MSIQSVGIAASHNSWFKFRPLGVLNQPQHLIIFALFCFVTGVVLWRFRSSACSLTGRISDLTIGSVFPSNPNPFSTLVHFYCHDKCVNEVSPPKFKNYTQGIIRVDSSAFQEHQETLVSATLTCFHQGKPFDQQVAPPPFTKCEFFLLNLPSGETIKLQLKGEKHDGTTFEFTQSIRVERKPALYTISAKDGKRTILSTKENINSKPKSYIQGVASRLETRTKILISENGEVSHTENKTSLNPSEHYIFDNQSDHRKVLILGFWHQIISKGTHIDSVYISLFFSIPARSMKHVSKDFILKRCQTIYQQNTGNELPIYVPGIEDRERTPKYMYVVFSYLDHY